MAVTAGVDRARTPDPVRFPRRRRQSRWPGLHDRSTPPACVWRPRRAPGRPLATADGPDGRDVRPPGPPTGRTGRAVDWPARLPVPTCTRAGLLPTWPPGRCSTGYALASWTTWPRSRSPVRPRPAPACPSTRSSSPAAAAHRRDHPRPSADRRRTANPVSAQQIITTSLKVVTKPMQLRSGRGFDLQKCAGTHPVRRLDAI